MGRSKGAIDEVKQRVASEINENVNRVKEALTASGKAMQQLAAKIDKELTSVSRDAGDLTDEHLQTADKYLKEYGEYRYYVGLGISSLLLLILICVICGLLCGICGKRPDGYGDDCCNKGAGGRFLMMYVISNANGFVIGFNIKIISPFSGVAIIFLTLSVLTVCVLIHFLVGLFLHRITCVSLK